MEVKARGVGMENSNFRQRDLTNTSCSQTAKINLNSNSHNDTSYLQNNGMKMALHLCGSSSKNMLFQSRHEINIIQVPVEGQSTNCLAGSPEKCQGHQK